MLPNENYQDLIEDNIKELNQMKEKIDRLKCIETTSRALVIKLLCMKSSSKNLWLNKYIAPTEIPEYLSLEKALASIK